MIKTNCTFPIYISVTIPIGYIYGIMVTTTQSGSLYLRIYPCIKVLGTYDRIRLSVSRYGPLYQDSYVTKVVFTDGKNTCIEISPHVSRYIVPNQLLLCQAIYDIKLANTQFGFLYQCTLHCNQLSMITR